MAYTQDHRLIAITTPLGKDVLLLQGFSGRESISRMFHFTADLLSENHSIASKDIVGKRVTICLGVPHDGQRYWNGFISRFAFVGRDERFSRYRAEIVPWSWFLTRTADCEIFQQKTIPDILKKVFGDFSFNDFQNKTQATYTQREYVVQYRETSFNFVSRLMEEYGIFYFFDHDKSSHKLIFADKPSVHKSCAPQSTLRFNVAAGANLQDEDYIFSWDAEEELRPGKYALTDYNFETPSTSLLSQVTTVDKVADNTNFEVFDYPGIFLKKDQGSDMVNVRMEEEETSFQIMTGSSNARSFSPGSKFTLSEHIRKEMDGDYLLTDVSHSATVGQGYYSGEAGNQEVYSNHFTCIPFATPFRPPRITPKPIVQGPQTAVVVGPKDEEIYPDKYGRVKVQFFWDRLGKKNENSSCWIRVSQPWAGKNWGAINIPRIGQEVIVEFLEGDPDRPIITGRVYNADQMPPYALPDNMTRTTFLSRSSKKGTSSNFNELRFEDKKEDEQIFMNAEKDMDWRVEKESREFVGANRHMIVKSSQFEEVDGDKQTQVKGKHIESITGDTSIHIAAKHMEKVDSDESITIGGNRKEQVTNNESIAIGQSRKVQIGQNDSITIGQNRNSQIGGNDVTSATQAVYITGGMNVVIQAGMQLSLVGPGGFIDIGPAGVSIQGTMVLINSGGAPGSAQSASPDSPDSPDTPADPKVPDTADDGTKGGKLNQ
ncbi:MAG TPA: type VI secretion system tip protein TssI/VgrG [Candidatus Acidoferrum sp.]|nr:type VI secretion system tip protein TssI/VgrG [Candidatus Acidoferrum sp.]